MTTALCYGRITKTTKDVEDCELMGSDKCPLMQRKFKKLGEDPCCYAIFIPATDPLRPAAA